MLGSMMVRVMCLSSHQTRTVKRTAVIATSGSEFAYFFKFNVFMIFGLKGMQNRTPLIKIKLTPKEALKAAHIHSAKICYCLAVGRKHIHR